MPSTPGPSEVDPIQISLPVASLPNLHTTCPPEDDRDHHMSGDHRLPTSEEMPGLVDATNAQQVPTPEADAVAGAMEETQPEDTSKRIEGGEEVEMRDTPSPIGSVDEPKDSDSRLAQSMSATVLSTEHSSSYIHNMSNRTRSRPSTSCSFLRPGSRFEGTQQSDRQVYNVQVELKHVDMEESFLCGYLRIQGLTDDHPTLTTYFEGEIIGNKYAFKTAHPEWGSTEKVDMQHWNRFGAWRPLAKQHKAPNFTYKNPTQGEHLFMRWKEYFLVPDHKVKTITGASFEGFYYICFNQCHGTVSGIYFHAKSEKYQQLELQHVRDRGCMGAMEFR